MVKKTNKPETPRKMWSIYPIEYYSKTASWNYQTNEWDFKKNQLSELTQTWKDKHGIYSLRN